MKHKILFASLLFLFLVGTSISMTSALTTHEQEIYNKMDFFTGLKFLSERGFFLFTSWGQANGCSVNPDFEGWVQGGASNQVVDCSKVSSDKCAIDVWYDNTIYLGAAKGPPLSVNWNNYLKEVTGSSSFSGSSYPWYYVQVYSCPTTTPTVTAHSTTAYVCQNGKFDVKGNFAKTDSCSWDTSGGKTCWCSSSSDNFYVDNSGLVHCAASSNPTWCPAVSTGTGGTVGSTNNSVAKGEIIINGKVQVIAPPLISDHLATINVPLKNFGAKSEVINLEAGFYSAEYATGTAKLYSVFPFFSSVPIPNVNPAENFVSTQRVTLAPGESQIVQLKVNPMTAFATYPLGSTNVKTKPLVWFTGLYITSAGGYTNEAGDVGKGILFDYGQYVQNPLFGGCSNFLGNGIDSTDIFCGQTKIGSCQGDILTLTDTCNITSTLQVINGTPATAIPTSTTLTDAKKIALTKDQISQGTSSALLASSCLQSSECILVPGDEKDNSAACVSITKLRADGTLTQTSANDFFGNANSIITGTGLGAGVGITACIVTSTAITAITGFVSLPITAPLLLGCGAAGAALGGSATNVLLDISHSDNLLTQLKAKNADAVGICTEVPKSSFAGFFSGLAFFDINGDGKKDATDGMFIAAIGAFILLIIILRSGK